MLIIAILVLTYTQNVDAIVPGVGPRVYQAHEILEVKASPLESVYTQTPLNYYDLPFCRPKKIVSDIVNLGDALLGQSLQTTPYLVKFLEPKKCETICIVDLDVDEIADFEDIISDGYRVNMEVDYMYALTQHIRSGQSDKKETQFSYGYPVGTDLEEEGMALYNHIKMLIKYNAKNLVVGFEVQPYSIAHLQEGDNPCGDGSKMEKLILSDDEGGQTIRFTYDVEFVPLYDALWSNRYALYLNNYVDNPTIHWMSIMSSLSVVLLLSGIVAMILLRVLYRDIAKYNEILIDDDDIEETGWKLIHGDVFRKPPHSTILAAFVGSGVQILGMLAVTVIFVGLNIFSMNSPISGMVEFMIFLWALMGVAGGYVSARLYKLFKSTNWKMTTIRTASVFPAAAFSVFFILNIVMSYNGSSAAVPFATLISLLLIWFLISTPLIFFGAFLGFRQEAISLPVRVHKIPRQIPSQPIVMNSVLCSLIGGALAYGALFTELLYIFASIWQHRFYYFFGFLFLVLIILVVTCAEISILLVYFQLVCENYSWWWRSFFASGSCAFYVMAYAVYYFCTRLRLAYFSSVMLYFGYSLLLAYALFLLTGAAGFIATLFFLRKIYGSIKVD